MRLWVWLGWALALPSCAGDYPLPPTPCDDLCHATQGSSCADSYEPASCVASCEAGRMDRDECLPALYAVVGCFQATPSAIEERCSYNFSGLPLSCSLELEAFNNCIQLSF